MSPMFDKNGDCSKKSFRLYCYVEGCKKYIMAKWGGGYGCMKTKDGTFDSRNKVWVCSEHSEVNYEYRD